LQYYFSPLEYCLNYILLWKREYLLFEQIFNFVTHFSDEIIHMTRKESIILYNRTHRIFTTTKS
jgi:hypothetical protein